MRIRGNKYVKALAERLGISEDCLFGLILETGIIEDNQDWYGGTLAECLDEQEAREAIETQIGSIGDDEFDCLMQCVIMGDGDCPICGGEMEITDEVGYWDETGIWIADERVEVERTCNVCGHVA